VARLPDPRTDGPELAELVGRIVAERGELLSLYRTLLHSPPLAAGWLSLLTSVRTRGKLPGSIRELVIMRVARLNGAPYEADQHRPIALSEGLTQAQLDAFDDWASSKHFDARERAVLAYTDAMTREVQVPDRVFGAVRAQFNDRELVELTATVAAYNMVSRFLEALQIRSVHERD
jgi:alkylhydroperoxidase family enzyme